MYIGWKARKDFLSFFYRVPFESGRWRIPVERVLRPIPSLTIFVMNWVNRERHIRTQLSGFSRKQLFLNYYYIIIIYVDLKNVPDRNRALGSKFYHY